jgi:predicted transposase YbfD/YdcC
VREGQPPEAAHSILLAQAGVGGALQAASSGESHNTGHDREEWRRCCAFDAGDRLYKGDQWRDLQSFALVERTRRIGDKTSVERRYYISSLAPDAEKLMRAVRSHWEVENRQHLCLDVQFGDDYARARTGHVAHNLALVRHIALNLIRLNTSVKTSIKTKRLLAATSDEFRAALLGFAAELGDDDEEDD